MNLGRRIMIIFVPNLFLLVMSVNVHIVRALFLNTCPAKLMWNLRGKDLCGISDNYLCLYDTNARQFRELCRDKPEFHRPGNIFVISGNLRYFAGRTCIGKRYQPHKWWTNGSSECQYLKSICNEEGQVPYDNGTITGNRKCRCDYTNYYTFVNHVNSTRDKCYCDPEEEDCSCYRKKCNEDEVLTPDYDCVNIHQWTGRFVCPEYKPLKITDQKESQTMCPNIEKDFAGTFQLPTARIAHTVIFGCIIVFGVMTIVLSRMRKSTMEDIQKIKLGANMMKQDIEKLQNELKATNTDIDTQKKEQKSRATTTDIDTQKLEQKSQANNIRDQIHRIIQEDKWQACALVLCILFDDGFNTDWLEINSTPKGKKAKLQEIVTECEIHFYCSTSMTSLKSAFTSLEGTYLTGILTEYKIIDVKMYKMVAVICGQHFTECFIKYASSKLIRDHFLFESVKEVKENDDRIMLSKDKEGKYFETLLFDLMASNIVSTFHNKQLKYPSFLSKLITFWKRNEDAKKILKDLDLKGFTYVIADYENKAYSFATTPLIESASGGYVEIVRFLIETVDCKVDNTDARGRSALLKACEGGHEHVVQLLLEKGASVLQRNKYGESPLYVACKGNHRVIVDILLQKNADVSVCTGSKKSPLYAACEGGYYDIVELVLNKHADVSQCNTAEESPLYVACAGGYKNIAELLLQNNADVSQCNNEQESPLYVACDGGHTDTVKLLLESNADVSQCNKEGESPMYVACKGGHTDTVIMLLKKNADVSQCNAASESPLFVACKGGYRGTVKLLLQNGANIKQCNKAFESPLYVACKRGHKETVILLLKKNADVNQCSRAFESPLYVACAGGYTDIVELLLENGADVKQCNKASESPLYVACAGGHTDSVKLLLQKGADVCQCNSQKDYPMHIACSKGFTDTVELLLQNDADVSQCNKERESPLYLACKGRYKDIVILLLKNGADVDQQNRHGESAFHVAHARGYTDIIQLLSPI